MQLAIFCWVVYLLTPTSNHNMTALVICAVWVVYLLTPTSNHNLQGAIIGGAFVVYLLTPTSNHNLNVKSTAKLGLYIFWLLHQTTTWCCTLSLVKCCISFDSYIKPQPACSLQFSARRCISFDSYIKPQRCLIPSLSLLGCISFDSYIKPQPLGSRNSFAVVVYLLTPTSNHNRSKSWMLNILLYIFWLLHQTTTARRYDSR